MNASVVCLLFASLLVIVLPRGNEGRKLKKNLNEQRKHFEKYDADNNGFISLHEFRITGSQEGFGEYIDFLMGEYDTNGDNQLSFKEFKAFSPTSDEA